jgi:hypothetical protein
VAVSGREAAISAMSKHPVFAGSMGSFMGVRFADHAGYHASNAILLHPRAFFYDPIELRLFIAQCTLPNPPFSARRKPCYLSDRTLGCC